MTAVAHPLPLRRAGLSPWPGRTAAGARTSERPGRAVEAGPRRPAARPSPAVFRRRRAGVAFVAAALLGGGAALVVPGEAPLASSGAAPAAPVVRVAHGTYVVRPGDTLWDIARALQPSGDVRPLVQRLSAGRGGAPLAAGERLALPGG